MHDTPKRLYLRLVVKLLLLIAFVIALYVLFTATEKQSTTEPTRLTTLRIPLTQASYFQRIPWQGGNLLLLRRSEAELSQLTRHDNQLLDPDSISSRQPANLPSPGRSVRPELFVAFDRGTDLGCPLQWVAAGNAPAAPLKPWPGGFRDSCGGSWYDAAGRVFKGQSATRNLDIPAYKLVGELLEVGASGDNPAPAN